jgi:hypothetical protein
MSTRQCGCLYDCAPNPRISRVAASLVGSSRRKTVPRLENRMKRWRVYFNRRGAPRSKAWCVDEGEGTRRRFFAAVIVEVTAITVYNGKQPDWQNPIAWLIASGKLSAIRTTDGRHAVIN